MEWIQSQFEIEEKPDRKHIQVRDHVKSSGSTHDTTKM